MDRSVSFFNEGVAEKYKDALRMLDAKKINRANAFEMRVTDYVDMVFAEGEASVDREYMWRNYSTGIDY
jgi:uncharacterized protein YifE (UPF0438 family)